MLEIRLIFNSVAPSSQLTSLLSQYKTITKKGKEKLYSPSVLSFFGCTKDKSYKSFRTYT